MPMPSYKYTIPKNSEIFPDHNIIMKRAANSSNWEVFIKNKNNNEVVWTTSTTWRPTANNGHSPFVAMRDDRNSENNPGAMELLAFATYRNNLDKISGAYVNWEKGGVISIKHFIADKVVAPKDAD